MALAAVGGPSFSETFGLLVTGSVKPMANEAAITHSRSTMLDLNNLGARKPLLALEDEAVTFLRRLQGGPKLVRSLLSSLGRLYWQSRSQKRGFGSRQWVFLS